MNAIIGQVGDLLTLVAAVAGIGVVVARQLSGVPENAMKMAVGLMLVSFGTFWIGEGAGLSSWNVLGGPSGTFTAYLPGPSGAEINVRTPDGTHLTPGGGQVLAEAVIAAIRTDFHVALPG